MKTIHVVLFALLLSGSAQASTITIGNDTLEGNFIPFSGGSSTSYQQVYSGSAFGSSPISISAIEFFAQPSFNFQLAGGTYTLSLSETSVAVNALSSNLAANVGINSQVVYSGPNELTFVLTTPYIYDPNAGNLLLNISGVNQTGSLDLVQAGITSLSSRAFDSSVYGIGTDNASLETTFAFSNAVPEPSTWAMLIIGFAAIGFVGASRHRLIMETLPLPQSYCRRFL
jgi:hypothetical protein